MTTLNDLERLIACTWKGTKPSLRFDSGAFKAAQPETYQQFCREQSSQRFLLKG